MCHKRLACQIKTGHKYYQMKHQKIIFLLVAVFAFLNSCSDTPKDMLVNVSVKGLKKGTLYLQKVEDSLIVNVDSISVNTETPFTLEADIESPELFYLFLDRKSTNPNDDRILFFGEEGSITLETSLENYFLGAKISGSVAHNILEEYQKMKKQFQNKRLELFKAYFEAEKANKKDTLPILTAASQNLEKRQLLYTINYAVSNADSEVAPYLAITEFPAKATSFLDTLQKSLSPKVKASKYGKMLEKYLSENVD